MAWEKFIEHKGEPLYLIPTEGLDESGRKVTRLQWIGRGDKVLIETRERPDAAFFASHTGIVLGITYPGEKNHGLLPGRALHLATSRIEKEPIATEQISRLVNLDMVLGRGTV